MTSPLTYHRIKRQGRYPHNIQRYVYHLTLSFHRDASIAATKKLEEFDIESDMREDVYQALLRYKAKGEKLEPDSQRCNDSRECVVLPPSDLLTLCCVVLDKMIEVFERNGLGLPTEKRERLKEIKKRAFNLRWIRLLCTNRSIFLTRLLCFVYRLSGEVTAPPSLVS